MEQSSQNQEFQKDIEDKPSEIDHSLKNANSSSKEDNEIVICNKCRLIPDNYIALNCQHNFCLPCLAQVFFKIIESKNFQYENQQIIVNCSVCGKQTELDKPSMDALEEAILVLGGLGQDIQKKSGKQIQFEPILEDSKEQIQTEENFQNQKSKKNDEQSRKQSNDSQQFQQDLLDDLQKNEIDVNIDTQSEPNLAEKQKVFENKRMKGNNKQLERQNQQLNQYQLKNIKNINEVEDNCKKFNDKEDSQLEKQANQFLENAIYKCPEHPTESNLLFCFTCNASNFCVECLLKGCHRNHIVRSIDNSEDILKERYQELKTQLKGKKDVTELVEKKILEKKTRSIIAC